MKVDGVVLKSELKHCPNSIQLPQYTYITHEAPVAIFFLSLFFSNSH